MNLCVYAAELYFPMLRFFVPIWLSCGNINLSVLKYNIGTQFSIEHWLPQDIKVKKSLHSEIIKSYIVFAVSTHACMYK